MAIVALIVTGDLEKRGLAQSLQAVFPDTQFLAPQKVDAFTSADLAKPAAARAGVPTTIEKLATARLAAIDPGRGKIRPDFVLGVEDLEMVNRHQPDKVVEALRNVVQAELERRRTQMNARSFAKFAKRVKEICSFHLFAPMPEAYFFADPDALAAAGCSRVPVLVPGRDVEEFETSDPEYLSAPPKPSPSWAIDPATRPFHPKKYIQFLLEPKRYRETTEGARALLALRWPKVMAQPQQTLFARSLFQDIADALGVDASTFAGDVHPLTADYKRQDRVLRNC